MSRQTDLSFSMHVPKAPTFEIGRSSSAVLAGRRVHQDMTTTSGGLLQPCKGGFTF